MLQFLQSIKDGIDDFRWSRAYNKHQKIRKEIKLREEALQGTTLNVESGNAGFIAFLNRRLRELYIEREKAAAKLSKIVHSHN